MLRFCIQVMKVIFFYAKIGLFYFKGMFNFSIYPSAHEPGMVQIPIGNNTGSLPDLTNMDFTSPIHAPLDQDQDSSPYSSVSILWLVL